MPENRLFLPEGLQPSGNYTLADLKYAQETGSILEAPVLRCDTEHTLHVALGNIRGVIPAGETVAPWMSGADRDISILSRVGKQTCFIVQRLETDSKGSAVAILSRRAAQEKAMDFFLSHLVPGMLLTCRATHLEQFGVFADIGCGIIALLPIELISISRISHPKERFKIGQKFPAVIQHINAQQRRITLTHRELLGSWMENASRFQSGETVGGIVRSVKEYGSFVELTPNLSGLADAQEPLAVGDNVSVFIKSIRPERMKIKLQVIEKLPSISTPVPMRYQITDGTLTQWLYSPPDYEKEPIFTDFTEPAP